MDSEGNVIDFVVDEAVIEQFRTNDRTDFNSNRRFYRWASDFGEYLEGMADREKQAEVKSVSDLLDEIESETLYLALVTVDSVAKKRIVRCAVLNMFLALPYGSIVLLVVPHCPG